MKINYSYQNALSLSNLKSSEIQKHIRNRPSLIFPIGGMEPFGEIGVIGIPTLNIDALASVLSQKYNVLTAPVFQYSCATSYKSFYGCIGIKPKTYCAVLNQLFNDCFFQGFERVLILNCSDINDLALDLLVKRFDNLKDKISIFSWQSNKEIKKIVGEHKQGIEMGRSEYMMLSVAAFLEPSITSKIQQKMATTLPNLSAFSTWKKRGRDPEKYRKLFPCGISSSIAHEFDSEFGKKIFDLTIDYLCKNYSSFLTAKEPDAS